MQDTLTARRERSLAMRTEHFSTRTLDTFEPTTARSQLDQFGAIHLQNTGLCTPGDLLPALPALGFGPSEQFSRGGRTSADWQKKWVVPGLRRMDHYPPDLFLLPNNEVQYQHFGPARVLFFCATPPTDGGRTFVHSAARVEEHLRRAGPTGRDLLQRFDDHGLMIETGFLDADHPRKAHNYFQSWQERFGTDDPDEALAEARRRTHEHDRCWWHTEQTGHKTLMTRIVLSAFKRDPRDGNRYLRFPRLALGPPTVENGHRRYPLGDGTPLSDAERALLMDAYLSTREGIPWNTGDIVMFDNIRYGHSRESFTGPREVYVGMAGIVWDDAVAPSPPPAAPRPQAPQRASRSPDALRYTLPDNEALWQEPRSARLFEAGGDVIAARSAVSTALTRHGAVHVRDTGLRLAQAGDLPDAVLDALGFGPDQQFRWGGFTSGRTARRALNPTLRATDDYPAARWLLPHNEILYQRQMPARLLFFSAHTLDPLRGGRTFVHSARQLEDHLRASAVGARLLADLEANGFLIEMGFLDEAHPDKDQNYFRSWQERFDSTDPDTALARCASSTDQFDACWWRDEGGGFRTLMTRVRIPAFQRHPQDGRRYLFFPRIALDGPALHNGYRRFPLGDGRPLAPEEIDVLLEAFLQTREGLRWEAGDLLLLDNIRYGHSREAFTGPRELGVAMAGSFRTAS